MATAYSTFDTTPAGVVAAVKAAILASSDWSNPAGDRVVCTTTRGASMVVDLADGAGSALRMQLGVYRTTGLADKLVRYIGWRNSGGATTDPIHCTVSAGKEHLVITIEGPRVGEPNAVDTTGSSRSVFFISDVIPYHSSDTTPVVVCGGGTSISIPASSNLLIYVSRNQGNTASWVPGVLETLQPPRGQFNSLGYRYQGQSMSVADGKRYLRPLVVFEDADGIRGRLNNIFFCGYAQIGSLAGDIPAPVLGRVSYNGVNYIMIPTAKFDTGSSSAVTPFGILYTGDSVYGSPIIAVPHS